jgi:uncharacterized protein
MSSIVVEIVHSPAERCIERLPLELPGQSTVADALQAGGVELGARSVAVWGQRATLQQALRDGDRIELLRPLQIDPKEARRLRARKAPPKAKRPAEAGR